ncbi:hypothetical protein NQZ79_g7578 [Umbelopsis isabellina]|nr:hypothetical protein NQZ79_g7578 [Umbelopsis isabellina]
MGRSHCRVYLRVNGRSNHRIWWRLAIQFVFYFLSIGILGIHGVSDIYPSICIADVISQIGLPTYIVYMTVYAPLVLLSILGTIAVLQGNAHGLRLNINMYYINIALILITDVVNIIVMSTARRDEIVKSCQNSNLKHSSNISYLVSPIGTALTVNTGCDDYWIKFVLFYVVALLGYLIIMILCILTLRAYRKYLLDHHISHDYEFGPKKSHVDSYPYDPEPIYSERHAYAGPQIKHENTSEGWDSPAKPEVQTEYYKSRPELYSKISHKNDLRRESLLVPSIAPGRKSPTLEKMEYDRFKGRRSSNIPLERESSIQNYRADIPSTSTQDLGDTEATGLLHDSTK